jgi:hypothetical protein
VSYIAGGLLIDVLGPQLILVIAGGAGVLVSLWVVAAARARGVEWGPAS